MANPIIDSISIVPPTLSPGQTAIITILAHDPDSTTIPLLVSVSDLAGHSVTAAVSLPIGDPLTYSVTIQSGGGTISRDPTRPNVFLYTAP